MVTTNYFGNTILTQYFINQPTWVALHIADPTVNGNLATELTGGSYARQRVTWTGATNKTVANNIGLQWLNLPSATITHFGVWNALNNGSCLWTIDAIPDIVINSGGQFDIPGNDLALVLG